MDRDAVVTCFLRHDAEVLLVRRDDDADTYPGRWGTVTGYVEHADPLASARMEIREETALPDFELARRGEPFEVRDPDLDRGWGVHPFLFDAESRDVRTNEETARAEWTTPTQILHRETVPNLRVSYDQVRPTHETVAADDEHGSAYLSTRALEVLRDEAALAVERGDGIHQVHATAEALLDARPSMAALENRVNRAVSGAKRPEEAERAAVDGIERALAVDERAAECAAEMVEGHVLTLSRSGTVLATLQGGAASSGVRGVTVAESRPAREGVDVATAADKISTESTVRVESGPPEAVYDGDRMVEAINPTFDVTPADHIDAVLTERGALSRGAIADVASELRELGSWRGN